MDMESAKKVPLNRITHSVRASQAVLQYGVGAMIDFPNQTLMTAAPEYWQEQVVQIHDERLEKVLRVDYFGLPGGQDDPHCREGIIDEGQDFGSEAIEETDIIQLIHDIIVDADQGGTFYVFYDRLQLIQAREMPKFIGDLDCRLTLYRNCRNTENIAVTSLRPITERKPKVFEGAVKGTPAKIHFCDSAQNERERIDSIIDDLAADGYRDIVLLTCKTEATSILSDSVNNGKYRNKYLFTTCRKFKGLEADVVILLDVDKTTFEQGNALIFYVGTSRARIKLEIAAILSDDDCKEILMSILNYRGKIRRAQKDLAGALNAIGSLDS